MSTSIHLRAAAVAIGVAALLSACAGAVARSKPASPAHAPRELRVLVYNTHAGQDAAHAPNLDRVAALVREVGAEVVLLQEVDRGTRRSGGVDQPATLRRLTGYEAAFGKTLDFDGGEYGIAILSRWPIARDTLVRPPGDQPQDGAGDTHEPRGALLATIAAPGGAITVVDTHLDQSRDDRWRRQELRTIVALADSARRHGTARAILVGGDFNSTPESEVHAAALRAGLRDAWAVCGSGDGFTFPADSAVKRIDYLYLTGDAGCREARVVPADASDHRPVLVRVTLP